ncbi:MAG: hypothetical protein OEZ34_12350 [Spirochaetia bacterium]|nr:hypothetical protein [Spirochaetia bacterium]
MVDGIYRFEHGAPLISERILRQELCYIHTDTGRSHWSGAGVPFR